MADDAEKKSAADTELEDELKGMTETRKTYSTARKLLGGEHVSLTAAFLYSWEKEGKRKDTGKMGVAGMVSVPLVGFGGGHGVLDWYPVLHTDDETKAFEKFEKQARDFLTVSDQLRGKASSVVLKRVGKELMHTVDELTKRAESDDASYFETAKTLQICVRQLLAPATVTARNATTDAEPFLPNSWSDDAKSIRDANDLALRREGALLGTSPAGTARALIIAAAVKEQAAAAASEQAAKSLVRSNLNTLNQSIANEKSANISRLKQEVERLTVAASRARNAAINAPRSKSRAEAVRVSELNAKQAAAKFGTALEGAKARTALDRDNLESAKNAYNAAVTRVEQRNESLAAAQASTELSVQEIWKALKNAGEAAALKADITATAGLITKATNREFTKSQDWQRLDDENGVVEHCNEAVLKTRLGLLDLPGRIKAAAGAMKLYYEALRNDGDEGLSRHAFLIGPAVGFPLTEDITNHFLWGLTAEVNLSRKLNFGFGFSAGFVANYEAPAKVIRGYYVGATLSGELGDDLVHLVTKALD